MAYFIILIQFPWERFPVLHFEDLRLEWGPPAHYDMGQSTISNASKAGGAKKG